MLNTEAVDNFMGWQKLIYSFVIDSEEVAC